MDFQITSEPTELITADWLIVGMLEEEPFDAVTTELDDKLKNRLSRMREAGDLTGKYLKTVTLYDVPELSAKRVSIIGLGKREDMTLSRLRNALQAVARATSDQADVEIALLLHELTDEITEPVYAESVAVAVHLGTAGQDLYRAEPAHYPFQKVTLVASEDANQSELQDAVERSQIIGECINLTRELVNRPAADIYPESVAERAEEVAKQYGIECNVLKQKQLKKERMGSLLAVAQGSEKPARLVELVYKGASDDSPTLALIGKGVTFDSGGLSIKPTEGMKTMKCDMAGAATVLGAITAIARLELPVNVTGYLGLVENMINGNSYKLGDVLTARNGVTIEVLNTDAEGRLVLADVLCYADDRGASHLVDLATLTGACVVALGEEITGAFANDQDWCDQLKQSAEAVDELIWEMPMNAFFAEQLKSDVADCKNVGPRWGGAITAAKFLEKFVDDKPWIHLDIAGPSFAGSNKPHREGGGTGCMVQTLVHLAESYPLFQSELIDV